MSVPWVLRVTVQLSMPPEVVREAIVNAENNQAPIKLFLKRGKELITLTLDYHGGLRYPHLQRVESTPDLLDTILAPVK